MDKTNIFALIIQRTPHELKELLHNLRYRHPERHLADEIMKIHSHNPELHKNPDQQKKETRKKRFKELKVFNLVRALLLKHKVENIVALHDKKEVKENVLQRIHHLIAKLSHEKKMKQIEEDQEIDEKLEEEQENEQMKELDNMQKATFQSLLDMLEDLSPTEQAKEDKVNLKEELLELITLTPQFAEKHEHERDKLNLPSLKMDESRPHRQLRPG